MFLNTILWVLHVHSNWFAVGGWVVRCVGVFGVHFLDYCVAARGTSDQTDPVPGEPVGDMSLPEFLGNDVFTHTHARKRKL